MHIISELDGVIHLQYVMKHQNWNLEYFVAVSFDLSMTMFLLKSKFNIQISKFIVQITTFIVEITKFWQAYESVSDEANRTFFVFVH